MPCEPVCPWQCAVTSTRAGGAEVQSCLPQAGMCSRTYGSAQKQQLERVAASAPWSHFLSEVSGSYCHGAAVVRGVGDIMHLEGHLVTTALGAGHAIIQGATSGSPLEVGFMHAGTSSTAPLCPQRPPQQWAHGRLFKNVCGING